MEELAYEDTALPINEGQTISQPYVVALMIEALGIKPDDRVLEVGAGSGYAAAVLARMAREVVAVERIRSLAESAQKRLEESGYHNVRVIHDDQVLGWPEGGPYDAILVSAGAPGVPENLVAQLAPGGRMLIPVGDRPRAQELVLVRKTARGFERISLGGVRFVPLVGREAWAGVAPDQLDQRVAAKISDEAEQVTSIEEADLSRMMDRIGDARLVMLGAATYGTSEFYRMRTRITEELILRKSFSMIAVEAGRPDWMWNNLEMMDLVTWVRELNREREELVSFVRLHQDDRLMFETLEEMLGRGDGRIVVWAHNSHVGDAGYTELGVRGEINLGNLVRNAYPRDVYLVGFGTHHGTMVAAREWNGPPLEMKLRPAHANSYEHLMHETELSRFLLPLRSASTELRRALGEARLERSIGLIYRPETEIFSHYYEAILAREFDEYVWFDESSAITPEKQPRSFPASPPL
jgi:protein-L-isoaspartate(D-aspartate) O-methyltransferase